MLRPELPPEIETLTADDPRNGAMTPFAEVVVAMVQGIGALWNAIVRPQTARAALPPARSDRRRALPPAPEESSK